MAIRRDGISATDATIIELPAGLHRGVPNHVYHGRHLGLVSKGALDLIARSPAHYKAWVDGKVDDESSAALDFGSAFHCALLEPDLYARRYVVQPEFGDCRKTENRTARNAWLEANKDAVQVSAEDADRIKAMIESVKAHPLASRMLADGEPEITVRWTDPETGLQCKCRPDYYVRGLRMVVDAKSTVDGSAKEFRRAIVNYGYHWQDALYRIGMAAVGEQVEHFAFLAVEKSFPHAVAVYTIDRKGVERGAQQVRAHMRLMAECLNSGTWPGYPVRIQEIELPPWAA